MLSFPRQLSALALIAAIVTSTAATLLAWDAMPERCTMERHECSATPAIAQCCRGHENDAANQGGPIESRVRLTADLSPVPVALVAAVLALHEASTRVHTSPPRLSPLDLLTLFATLLI